MRETLTVAAAQPVAVAHDVAANAAAHAGWSAPPERGWWCFRSCRSPAMNWTRTSCRRTTRAWHRSSPRAGTRVTLALAGAPVDGPHIGVLAVDGRSGRVEVAYRKAYLGESERVRFQPAGTGPTVVQVDGWRLGLAVCKDTSIPEHWADTAALGIDAYVAGLTMFDVEAGEQDRRGQLIAKTHGVWVVFASFAGSTGDGYDRCAGRSAIWGPDGAVRAQAGPDPGEFVTAALRP